MQPRFVFIKSQLLDDIAAGDMKPGDKIPSENQLAEQYGVSRMTARRAITELVNEGILVRSARSRHFCIRSSTYELHVSNP